MTTTPKPTNAPNAVIATSDVPPSTQTNTTDKDEARLKEQRFTRGFEAVRKIIAKNSKASSTSIILTIIETADPKFLEKDRLEGLLTGKFKPEEIDEAMARIEAVKRFFK